MKVTKGMPFKDQIHLWLDEQRLELDKFIETLGDNKEGYKWQVEMDGFKEGIDGDYKISYKAKEVLI